MPTETILTGCWSGDGVVCAGCGGAIVEIDRLDAVGVVGDLSRRFSAMLERSDAVLCRRPGPQSWSVLESVIRACAVLGAAQRTLARLSALHADADRVVPEGADIPPLGVGGTGTMAVFAALSARATVLARAITAWSDHDWHCQSGPAGMSAAQMTWLLVHHAVHHVEDAEVALTTQSAALAGPHGHGAW